MDSLANLRKSSLQSKSQNSILLNKGFKRPLQIQIIEDDPLQQTQSYQNNNNPNNHQFDETHYLAKKQQALSPPSSDSKVYLTQENMPDSAPKSHRQSIQNRPRLPNFGIVERSNRHSNSDYEISSSSSSARNPSPYKGSYQQQNRHASGNEAYLHEQNTILKQKVVELQEQIQIHSIQKHELLQIIKQLTTHNEQLKTRLIQSERSAEEQTNNSLAAKLEEKHQNVIVECKSLKSQLTKLKSLYRCLEKEIDSQRNYSRKLEEDLKQAMDYKNAYINAQTYLNRHNPSGPVLPAPPKYLHQKRKSISMNSQHDEDTFDKQNNRNHRNIVSDNVSFNNKPEKTKPRNSLRNLNNC